jgi:hypothetical protein
LAEKEEGARILTDFMMTPEEVERHFTGPDGAYVFARWGRPVVPVVFGVDEETLTVVKGAIEAVVTLAGHKMAETDPELGANLMMFFVRDWNEVLAVPNLERMIPDLAGVVARLEAADANRYRAFRFGNGGGIQACFVFLRMQGALAETPAADLALGEAVQAVLLWARRAFAEKSPLAVLPQSGVPVLRPETAALVRAAYDPVLPVATADKSHALRLLARMRNAGA